MMPSKHLTYDGTNPANVRTYTSRIFSHYHFSTTHAIMSAAAVQTSNATGNATGNATSNATSNAANQTNKYRQLIIDTETNGIGTFNPPTQRLVQVSWICSDGTEKNFFIRGVKAICTSPSYPCKHITIERLERDGVSFQEMWAELRQDLLRSTHVVAHNADFDIGIIARELKIHGLHADAQMIRRIPRECTMKRSENYCALPKTGKGAKYPGYKYPRLDELYVKMFDRKPNATLHDSREDCRVLQQCYAKGLELRLFGARRRLA